VYKIDPATGSEVSRVEIGYTTYSPIYAEGDSVYIYARDHNVYAVDTVNNNVAWKFSSYIK
jgi:outer membrane protein assembly factor BamB